MVDAFFVVPATLDGDAEVWDGWQEQLDATSGAVPIVGAALDPWAFSLLPGAPEVMIAYRNAAQALADSLGDGAEQFSGMAAKLRTVAGLYRDAEERNLAEIRSASEG